MCICINHGDCKGLIIENEVLRNFCSCNCHDSGYQLIRNSIARNNVENPWQLCRKSKLGLIIGSKPTTI